MKYLAINKKELTMTKLEVLDFKVQTLNILIIKQITPQDKLKNPQIKTKDSSMNTIENNFTLIHIMMNN